MNILITTAKHFAKVGDGKFLFGLYFAKLFAFYSFKGLGTDVSRQKRAKEIRNRMSMKQPYPERERPDRGNDPIDVCRCAHEWFMHASGQPNGACLMCLCPGYEFEQKLTRLEVSDLQSVISDERRKR